MTFTCTSGAVAMGGAGETSSHTTMLSGMGSPVSVDSTSICFQKCAPSHQRTGGRGGGGGGGGRENERTNERTNKRDHTRNGACWCRAPSIQALALIVVIIITIITTTIITTTIIPRGTPRTEAEPPVQTRASTAAHPNWAAPMHRPRTETQRLFPMMGSARA